MRSVFRNHFFSAALLALSFMGGLASCGFSLLAQTSATAARPKAPLTEIDLFKELQKLNAVNGQDERMKALAQLVKTRPELFRVDGGGANLAFMAGAYIKDNAKDPVKLRAWLMSFVPLAQAALKGSGHETSEFDMRMASGLLNSDVLLPQAKELTQQALDSYRQEDFIAREKSLHEERAAFARKGKEADGEPFDMSDALEHANSALSSRYSLLGKLQAEMGDDAGAIKSYALALKAHADMQAYLGESALEEKNGDKQGALELLFDAELTGHLKTRDIQHMKSLYLELHPGSNEAAMDAELDAQYEKSFKNPVKFTLYEPGKDRSSRVALAELFTGAGCESCMSPDLAFDAALELYKRNEMVLLVYHDNAPVSDPLANPATQERAKYYETHGSTPHVFLDGTALKLAEGLPDHAQQAADELFPAIDKTLTVLTDASIEIAAQSDGYRVDVTVRVHAPESTKNRKLQVALIERQLSYSGENTLRIQRMVVRAMAQQTDAGTGFEVPASGTMDVKCRFDLAKIEAVNLAYYDQFDQELKKRTHDLSGAEYREKKTAIDPARLAVAAFLQDADKQVVQAAYSDLH